MATGVLLPMPRLQEVDGNGAPLALATLDVYLAGTVTPTDSYSDAGLTTANANPVVADANGRFGAIFLNPALAYKVVLKNAAGTTIYTADNLTDYGAQLAAFLRPCNGRLTLESGVPISSTDQSAKTTIYFTPFLGNSIALYDTTASRWVNYSFTERSLTLVGLTAATLYDIVAYNDAGTVTLEAKAWSSGSNRAFAITLQDGTYVLSDDRTRRYLGTVYINATGGQSDDALAKRYVWNYYNRVQRTLGQADTNTSWTYTTATIRQARGAADNQVECCVGVAEINAYIELAAVAANSSAGVAVAVGIGLDSTTAFAGGRGGIGTVAAVNALTPLHTALAFRPAQGRRVLAWLEWSAATGTTTWYAWDVTGGPSGTRHGLTGFVEA